MANTHNLFISHSWSYGDAYTKLVQMLDNRSYFFYKNYSVPKDDPIHNAANRKQLYEAIKRQIQYAHVVIIMSGVYSTYSEWINYEIEIAAKGFTFPKPVLAIEPWGSLRTSQKVTDAADLVVGWNTDSIVSGIRKLSSL